MIPYLPPPCVTPGPSGSRDPRLEPIEPADAIDELVNEQLERGRTDLR